MKKLFSIFAITLLMFTVFTLGAIAADNIRIHFIDVGQRDSILIELIN